MTTQSLDIPRALHKRPELDLTQQAARELPRELNRLLPWIALDEERDFHLLL